MHFPECFSFSCQSNRVKLNRQLNNTPKPVFFFIEITLKPTFEKGYQRIASKGNPITTPRKRKPQQSKENQAEDTVFSRFLAKQVAETPPPPPCTKLLSLSLYLYLYVSDSENEALSVYRNKMRFVYGTRLSKLGVAQLTARHQETIQIAKGLTWVYLRYNIIILHFFFLLK